MISFHSKTMVNTAVGYSTYFYWYTVVSVIKTKIVYCLIWLN